MDGFGLCRCLDLDWIGLMTLSSSVHQPLDFVGEGVGRPLWTHVGAFSSHIKGAAAAPKASLLIFHPKPLKSKERGCLGLLRCGLASLQLLLAGGTGRKELFLATVTGPVTSPDSCTARRARAEVSTEKTFLFFFLSLCKYSSYTTVLVDFSSQICLGFRMVWLVAQQIRCREQGIDPSGGAASARLWGEKAATT